MHLHWLCFFRVYVWLWNRGMRKDHRVHVLRVHLQVHILWVCQSVFVCLCFRPKGQHLRSGECVAHSCFSIHWSGRSGGWEDRLLTTSPVPPSTHPPSATGPWHRWEWGSLTHPLFWTSLTPFSFKFNVPLFLSQSSFYSQSGSVVWGLQSFFISVSKFLTDGSALVEQQSGFETRWLETHWMGKSTPLENLNWKR